MWPFKQFEGLRSFKLEEANEKSLLSSNAVANYNNKNGNNNKIPLVNKILFAPCQLRLVSGRTFPYESSLTETGQLRIGTEKSPTSYMDCNDFLYFSQLIANNRLGESRSTCTLLAKLSYTYSYIYKSVTKSKIIFSNMILFFLILVLFMPTPLTLNLITSVVSPSPILRT